MIDIRRLAKELGRSIKSLIALDSNHDPFNTGIAFRRRDAEWIASLWHDMGEPAGVHIRRWHYYFVSKATPFPNGEPYENTRNCAHRLDRAVRDAIGLDLIPDAIIVDNKNPSPIEAYISSPTPAALEIDNEYSGARIDLSSYLLEDEPVAFAPTLPQLPFLPNLPSVSLASGPTVPQRYHIEVWIEKSTMNDIIMPLRRRFGVGVATATGDFSATACRDLVTRAEESGRPVRIIYVSDFDGSGMSMPVGVSRKIEYEIYKRNLQDIDIKVDSVALTHQQCVDLNLPRTPTKDTDSRARNFEERFGEGQVELDSLEALYPGKLAEILTKEILRYYDLTLDRRVSAAVSELEDDLNRLNHEIVVRHRPKHIALETERREIEQQAFARQQQFERDVQQVTERAIEDLKPLFERAQPIYDQAADVCAGAHAEIKEKLPDLDGMEWPEPEQGDEPDDALFDSQRDYLEQIDRYKRHQGKE